MSRTIARPITGPLHAPKPWKRRAATSHSIDGAVIDAIDPTMKTASPVSSTGRRPKRSENGP